MPARDIAAFVSRVRSTPLDGYLLVGIFKDNDEIFDLMAAPPEVKRELEDYVLAIAAQIADRRKKEHGPTHSKK